MSDKYVIEFGDEELLIGEHSYRRIQGTNTLMCDDDIKCLTPAESKEETKTIKDIKTWEEYWYIDDSGDYASATWMGDVADHWRRNSGNAFLTKQEAEFYLKRQEVLSILLSHAEPLDTQWDLERKHFYLTAQLCSGSIGVFDSRTCKLGGIYFATEEDARKAIDDVGDERLKKYYFMVEE